MTRKTLRLSAVLLATTAFSCPSFALQANTDGAKKLADVFETYLGKPSAGKTGAVTVVPDGEGYRVTLSLAALAAPVANGVFNIEGGSVVFSATEQPDGNWHVVSNAPLQATVKIGPQVQTVQWDGVKYDGVFSPKLGAFVSATSAAQKGTQTVSSPEVSATSGYSDVLGKLQSTPAGVDAVTTKIDQSFKDFHEELTFSIPKKEGDPARPDIKAGFRFGSGTSTIVIDSFRARRFLDLWAFLVAHPSREAIATGQADLKAILRPLLPLFQKMSGDVAVNDVGVQTPVGAFAVKSLAGNVDFSGLVSGAKFGEDFKLAGLSIPPGLAPAWSAGLVPTAAAFGFRIEGLDLGAASKEAVEDFTLNAPAPFNDADIAKIVAAVAPGNTFKVALTPGRLTSALLDVSFDGVATVVIPAASGRLNVHAKGVDAALAALQKGMATDKNAAQAFGVLTMAKGFGKPGADGATDWVIDYSPEGGVTINGAAMGGKGK